MKKAEFNDWWEHHCTFYPGLNTWLEKQREPASILEAWDSVLYSVSLDDAKNASKELYGQEKQPQAYERHAATIRAIASARRAENAESRNSFARYGQTYKCRDCADTGWCVVGLLEPLLSKATIRRGDQKAARLTQAVVCFCAAGDEITKSLPRSIRFDPSTMLSRARIVASEPATTGDWERIRQFRHGIGQPAAIAAVVEQSATEKAVADFYGPPREPGEEG